MKTSDDTLLKRFWAKVDRLGPDECWPWLAAKHTFGYGKILAHGRLASAHRIAYELEVGRIPQGHHVHHRCGVPACVNPAHLEALSPAEHLRRGPTLTARFAAVTHCPKGHPYDIDNTYRHPLTGYRACRACHREWARRRRTTIR